MKGVKNDFSMTFYKKENQSTKHKKVLHLHYVHNTEKAIIWCKSHNIEWDYANIYQRRTAQFLERVYNPQSQFFFNQTYSDYGKFKRQ